VQCALVEVREFARAGKVSHINDDLDLMMAQDVDELFDRAGRVADGPDCEWCVLYC
jgi:hypothetical protein